MAAVIIIMAMVFGVFVGVNLTAGAIDWCAKNNAIFGGQYKIIDIHETKEQEK